MNLPLCINFDTNSKEYILRKLKMPRCTNLLALIMLALAYVYELPGKEEKSPQTPSNFDSAEHSVESPEKATNKDDADKEGANNAKKEEKPPKIGNFSLPISQQPAGLFAFGGNIIDKDEVQLYLFSDGFFGKKHAITDVIPGILYGISETFTIFLNTPFTPYFRYDRHRTRGLEDFFVQLEYAFYNKTTKTYADQATVVGNVTFPTGSIHKDPPTGFGSPSVFLGGTFYRTWVDWYVLTGLGAILTTSDNGNKFGDQFLYQMGFGKNFYTPKGWIFAWMMEVDGQYNKKNRFNGITDTNSGGNVIYATPSIWISSKQLIIQFGISLPVTQNLFGHQHKFDYAFNLNFGWSFY